MSAGRVCPRCGRGSGEVAFIGPLCRDCYVEVVGVARLPPMVHFVYCQYCGRYKYQGGWNEPTGGLEDTLRDFLYVYLTRKLRPTEHVDEAWIDEVRFERSVVGPGIYRAIVRVSGRAGSVIASEERIVNVKVDAAVCPLCTNRITKRGYNAIIQVRSSSGRLSDSLRRRVEEYLRREIEGRLSDSIIGVEEHREGFDLLVSDPSSARMIASKLRSAFMAKTVETYKLVGRNQDGSRRGRLTISVRIPEIEPGDLIDIGGRPHLFIAQGRGGSPIMVDLTTGREYSVDPDNLWEQGFRRHPEGAETRRYMLLSKSPRTVVFLDADTGYSSVVEVPSRDVRVYVDDFSEGGVFKVFISGRRVYVIGREEVE